MRIRPKNLITSLSVGVLVAAVVVTVSFTLESRSDSAARTSTRVVSASAGFTATDVSAAEDALARAITLQQTMLVPPSAKPALSKEPKASLDVADASVFLPTSADSQAMIDRGFTQLATVYTGTELDNQRAVLTNWANGLAKRDVLTLDGGADSFKYDSAAYVDSATIEIKGSARTWAQYAQIQKNTRLVSAAPSNVIDYDAMVTLGTGDTWRVSKFSWTFAPGSEP